MKLVMKALLRDYFIALGSYVAVLAVGLVMTLTISSAVGYLPYSDRPGPGWTEPHFSFGQLAYYASWSVLLLIPSAIYGTVLFAYLRILKLLDAPWLIIRSFGAVGAGVVALVLAAGTGWYISMAASPVWVATGLGTVWGAVLLPRYLGPSHAPRVPWIQWTTISFVLLAGPSALYWTWFAPRYAQDFRLNVVRVIPSDERLLSGRWAHALEPQEAAVLDSVFRNGRLERGVTGMSGSGDESHVARMLVVVTAPLIIQARLRVPKGVSVVYIQRGDRWDMFPADAPTLKQRITVGPGSKPNQATFAWPRSDTTTFSWSPD